MLDTILGGGSWLLAHYQELLAGVSALLGAAITITLVIPGEQPEKALQKAAELLAKISRK